MNKVNSVPTWIFLPLLLLLLCRSAAGPTIYTSGPVIADPPDPSIAWIFRLLVIAGLLALGAAG